MIPEFCGIGIWYWLVSTCGLAFSFDRLLVAFVLVFMVLCFGFSVVVLSGWVMITGLGTVLLEVIGIGSMFHNLCVNVLDLEWLLLDVAFGVWVYCRCRFRWWIVVC